MKSIDVAGLADHRPGSERLVRDRARGDGGIVAVRRAAGVRAADGDVDLRGPCRWWRPS